MAMTIDPTQQATEGEKSAWHFQTQAELATTGNHPGARTLRSFFINVDLAQDGSACWLWRAATNEGGYGVYRGRPAHRWSYRWFVGAFDPQLELDHLCRVRECVNPAHVEPVTRAENRRRALAARTHCRHGHLRTPGNLVMHSSGRGRKSEICKICLDRSNAESRQRALARSAAHAC